MSGTSDKKGDLKTQMVTLLDHSVPAITVDEVRQKMADLNTSDGVSSTRRGIRRSRSTGSPLRSRRQKIAVTYGFALCVCILVGVLVGTGLHSTTTSKPGTASTTTLAGTQRPSGNPYPSDACDVADPVGLLLSLGNIPGMKAVGPPSAFGGESLDLHGGGPSSAAVIEEDWMRMGVPTSQLDSQGPYLKAHPHSIVTFDEAISGFTDTSAEAIFYNEASPTENQEVNVNGETLTLNQNVEQNISSLPRPNVVVTTNLPGTDVGTRVLITVKFGNTILGMSFFGGTDLTWSDVVVHAHTALRIITSHCKNGEILPRA
jgi:hypothetical protein